MPPRGAGRVQAAYRPIGQALPSGSVGGQDGRCSRRHRRGLQGPFQGRRQEILPSRAAPRRGGAGRRRVRAPIIVGQEPAPVALAPGRTWSLRFWEATAVLRAAELASGCCGSPRTPPRAKEDVGRRPEHQCPCSGGTRRTRGAVSRGSLSHLYPVPPAADRADWLLCTCMSSGPRGMVAEDRGRTHQIAGDRPGQDRFEDPLLELSIHGCPPRACSDHPSRLPQP